MQDRVLGKTGLEVSVLSFGAGPVSGLMTGPDHALQGATIARALAAGINWFDTAAGYGAGRSEACLGTALAELGAAARVHVATKVRLLAEDLGDIPAAVHRSLAESLRRLGQEQVTLLQLHNSVTRQRGDQPTSITVHDVLGPRGVLSAFRELQAAGRVRFLGLTALGDVPALVELADSGAFDCIQAPFNILNPSAGQPVAAGFDETDYGQIINHCAARGMGVIAIRVFAGGALAGQPPSAHTQTTKFFPLDLYQRDQARAAELAARLPPGQSLKEAALRFVLGHPHVATALVGLGSPEQVDEAVGFLRA